MIVGYNGGGGLHLLDGDGQPRWRQLDYGNCWNVGFARTGPDTGFILTTARDGNIHGLDPGGKAQWTIDRDEYFASIDAADLDGEGKDEILALTHGHPGEDLMQEHGVLERVLLVYGDAALRLEKNETLDLGLIASAARFVRRFVEDYHEKLEEVREG